MAQELKITSVEKPEEKIETVEFEISDDLFLKVAKAAHDRDITFNTMVNIIMKKDLFLLHFLPLRFVD